MSHKVDLQNPDGCSLDSEILKRAARAVLARHLVDEAGELSIVISKAKTIRAMNLRYANVNAPTDVLSFPAEPAPHTADDCARYLGDIVIAFDYAMDQADKTGAALGDALCLLVIHGTLHLLGYDHDTQLAREKMWREQTLVLRAMHVDPSVVEVYGRIENG